MPEEEDGMGFSLYKRMGKHVGVMANEQESLSKRGRLTVSVFQSRMLLSSLPLAIILASGLHAMVETPAR